MGTRILAGFAALVLLAGCAPLEAPGEPAGNFLNADIARAYIPLGDQGPIGARVGAAVVIAPGIAATCAHNADLLDPSSVIGTVPGYDLLYFHTERSAVPRSAAPQMGEGVIAYGHGHERSLRMSQGTVQQFWPAAFGYVSDAGPGFSGGPVVDARTGALLGITYGFIDHDGKRLMVAYSMDFVAGEWAKMQAATPPE